MDKPGDTAEGQERRVDRLDAAQLADVASGLCRHIDGDAELGIQVVGVAVVGLELL